MKKLERAITELRRVISEASQHDAERLRRLADLGSDDEVRAVLRREHERRGDVAFAIRELINAMEMVRKRHDTIESRAVIDVMMRRIGTEFVDALNASAKRQATAMVTTSWSYEKSDRTSHRFTQYGSEGVLYVNGERNDLGIVYLYPGAVLRRGIEISYRPASNPPTTDMFTDDQSMKDAAQRIVGGGELLYTAVAYAEYTTSHKSETSSHRTIDDVAVWLREVIRPKLPRCVAQSQAPFGTGIRVVNGRASNPMSWVADVRVDYVTESGKRVMLSGVRGGIVESDYAVIRDAVRGS